MSSHKDGCRPFNSTAILKASPQAISIAAEMVARGEVVGFPTETVYGLGADATNASAVRKIFELKGRPLDNPLIVHVSSFEMLGKIAHTDSRSLKLARKYWPGPLTIIFNKKEIIPDEVSAGLPTVAVRMPANRTALELIRESKVPIAAPSANLSSRPSPTSAQHVLEDFRGKLKLILDDGNTKIGVESTVVSLAGKPKVLRLGGFPLEKLQVLFPEIDIAKSAGRRAQSPGMKYRHYAPSKPLFIVRKKDFGTFAQKLAGGKRRALIYGENFPREKAAMIKAKFSMLIRFKSANDAAKKLFSSFRTAEKKCDEIYFAEIPQEWAGRAVMERVEKAARKR